MRRITSRFAPIYGIAIQPHTAPIHHTSGVLPKASRKFSVLIESSSESHIILILSLGFGTAITIMLPARVAAPTIVFTSPSTALPPPCFESIIAGSTALYADATRFMPAKKSIRYSTIRLPLSHESPSPADLSSEFFSLSAFSGSGIFINKPSVMNAAAKVVRSKAITASSPPNANSAVARTGVSILLSESENERRPLVR